MKKYKIIAFQIIVILFSMSFSEKSYSQFSVGKEVHGFRLLEKHFVKEVNAECLYFEHVKSGARLFKIAAADKNKTFAVSFKTEPNSDCGTPHIIEHSVLNGSQKFRVKSPFDELLKGSLKTFLNAMTGQDYTMYPVASMNDKDYFNLMNVYMDAVFNPLIYTDTRILKQEGWHYELIDKDGPVTIKGVVYNEMKGAFSSPMRELNYQINKTLFPGNGYGFSSGGYPDSIPNLTQEAFTAFHRKYYHPSNAYIVLYGDADLEKELAFLDKEYLSKFDREPQIASFAIQKAFEKPKEVTTTYPVIGGSNLQNKSFLSMSYVIGLNTDLKLSMALDVLADVLVNQESAPLRLALQKAGIGQDVRASTNNLRQNVLTIVALNTNAEDKDKFVRIVNQTLQDLSKKGLEKDAVEGAVNRIEFYLRESSDAQKGLTYTYQIKNSWMFGGNPFEGLQYEKPLNALKTDIPKRYLENIIEKQMVSNPFSVMVALNPEPDLEKKNNEKTAAKLAQYKASLSETELNNLISDTKKLIDFQKRQDTPEALASIPKLELKDISPEAEWYGLEEKHVSDNKILYHPEFTNHVVHVRFMFDMHVLPASLLPYAPLVAELLGKMNTAKYSYSQLNNQLNIHTGGFNVNTVSYLENLDDNKLIPEFNVTSKAMTDKTDKMIELLSEIVNHTQFDDKERLRSLIIRYQSRLDSRVKNNGDFYAMTRLSSYYSNQGMFREITEGLENYWFITDLARNFDQKYDTILNNIRETARLLFNKKNLLTSVTCDNKDYKDLSEGVSEFANSLTDQSFPAQTWNFVLTSKNEGIMTASKVQYVYKGYDFRKLGYDWSGKMRVANQAISRDWLQNQVRVIGGAYGGRAAFSPTGNVYFYSYRDPNLKETLANFDSTTSYLRNYNASTSDITQLIIGTVSTLDMPLTPVDKGNVAVMRYLQKTDREFIQKERDAVLQTTAQDIRQMEKLVHEIMQKNIICVYGNKEKIEASGDVFKNFVKIE